MTYYTKYYISWKSSTKMNDFYQKIIRIIKIKTLYPHFLQGNKFCGSTLTYNTKAVFYPTLPRIFVPWLCRLPTMLLSSPNLVLAVMISQKWCCEDSIFPSSFTKFGIMLNLKKILVYRINCSRRSVSTKSTAWMNFTDLSVNILFYRNTYCMQTNNKKTNNYSNTVNF